MTQPTVQQSLVVQMLVDTEAAPGGATMLRWLVVEYSQWRRGW